MILILSRHREDLPLHFIFKNFKILNFTSNISEFFNLAKYGEMESKKYGEPVFSCPEPRKTTFRVKLLKSILTDYDSRFNIIF